MEEKESLVQRAKDATAYRPLDSLRKSVQSLIDIFPVAGPVLNAIIFDHLPELKGRKLEAFIRDLAAELEQVKERITFDWERDEQFITFLHKTLRLAVEEIDEEKIRALKNILVNGLLAENRDGRKQEHKIAVLASLPALHVACLSAIFNPRGFLNRNGAQDRERLLVGRSEKLDKMLAEVMPELSEAESKAITFDLYSKGFLKGEFVSAGAVSVIRFDTLPQALTDFGKDFCICIIRPKRRVDTLEAV